MWVELFSPVYQEDDEKIRKFEIEKSEGGASWKIIWMNKPSDDSNLSQV